MQQQQKPEEKLITDEQAQQMIKKAIDQAIEGITDKIIAKALNKQKGIREMDYILDKKLWAQANGTMGSLKGRDIYVAVEATSANRPISLVFAFADDAGKFSIYGDKVGFEDNNAHDIFHSNYYKLAREIKSIMKVGGNIVALGMDKFMTNQITDSLVRCGISRVWLETVRKELSYGFLSSTVGVDMLERNLVSNRVKYCSRAVVESFYRCSIEQDNNRNRKLVKTSRESDISLAVAAAQCFGMIENDAVAEGVMEIFTPENIEQPKCPYAAGFIQGWHTGYISGQVKESMKKKGA